MGYRTHQIVLLTLLEPETKLDILRSELDDARERGYMETSLHGDRAVLMYLGDWERGLDSDWAGAYEDLRKNAMDSKGPRGDLAEYMQRGWISDFHTTAIRARLMPPTRPARWPLSNTSWMTMPRNRIGNGEVVWALPRYRCRSSRESG